MSILLDIARREHDKRVDEYRKLAGLLPQGMECAAIRCAVKKLRECGHPYVAEILAAYIERLGKADIDRCGV